MNLTKLYVILLSILIVFAACANNEQEIYHEIQTEQSLIPLPTETVEVSRETESSTQFTEPDLSLNVDSGSFLLRYTDQNTSDYLDYYIFIPENPKINMPLVVFLHGDGEVGKPENLKNYSMIASARSIYGNQFPFIAISPCTREKSWISGTIPQVLKGLLDMVVSEYAIDSERIIITGHSRGSTGVWKMISMYSDYFSAAMPISSRDFDIIDFENCSKVSVWAFAGSDGEYELSCQRAMQMAINQINQISDGAKFTILDGCDHSETKDDAFNEETFAWMLLQ